MQKGSLEINHFLDHKFKEQKVCYNLKDSIKILNLLRFWSLGSGVIGEFGEKVSYDREEVSILSRREDTLAQTYSPAGLS